MSPGFLCWMLVYLHPSRAFLVPTASSCNRAVPSPLLAARGSFSHRRFLLIDQLFFVFILFIPTGQWIHSLLSLLIFLDGQHSQKDFPKGLGCIQEELLEVGCGFGSTIYNRQEFGNSQEGTSPRCKLDYF